MIPYDPYVCSFPGHVSFLFCFLSPPGPRVSVQWPLARPVANAKDTQSGQTTKQAEKPTKPKRTFSYSGILIIFSLQKILTRSFFSSESSKTLLKTLKKHVFWKKKKKRTHQPLFPNAPTHQPACVATEVGDVGWSLRSTEKFRKDLDGVFFGKLKSVFLRVLGF